MSRLAEEEVGQAPWVVWAKRGVGAAVLVAVAVAAVFLVRQLGVSPGPQQKQMAKIRIVPDTPPPPPPPKEERKPEPPKDMKEVKVEQQKQPPAPTEQLKMEGEASDKGVAGLIAGSVNREYSGGPIGGSRFAWYGELMQQEVRQMLAKNPRLRSGDYAVVVKMWVTPEGRISRVELVSGSGRDDLDDLIRAALVDLPAMRERPPQDMPWPLKLRVTSRG